MGDLAKITDPLDLFGKQAATEAAEIQSEAALIGLEESKRQFDIGQEVLAPFEAESIPAFGLQARFVGARGPEEQALAFQEFRESPATQFIRESGLSFVPEAKGELRKELTRFGQGLAEQDFGRAFNRLGSVAGSGQTAQSTLASAGEDVAARNVNLLGQEAAARAGGIQGGQQATQNLAGTAAGLGALFSGGGNRPNTSTPPPSFRG